MVERGTPYHKSYASSRDNLLRNLSVSKRTDLASLRSPDLASLNAPTLARVLHLGASPAPPPRTNLKSAPQSAVLGAWNSMQVEQQRRASRQSNTGTPPARACHAWGAKTITSSAPRDARRHELLQWKNALDLRVREAWTSIRPNDPEQEDHEEGESQTHTSQTQASLNSTSHAAVVVADRGASVGYEEMWERQKNPEIEMPGRKREQEEDFRAPRPTATHQAPARNIEGGIGSGRPAWLDQQMSELEEAIELKLRSQVEAQLSSRRRELMLERRVQELSDALHEAWQQDLTLDTENAAALSTLDGEAVGVRNGRRDIFSETTRVLQEERSRREARLFTSGRANRKPTWKESDAAGGDEPTNSIPVAAVQRESTAPQTQATHHHPHMYSPHPSHPTHMPLYQPPAPSPDISAVMFQIQQLQQQILSMQMQGTAQPPPLQSYPSQMLPSYQQPQMSTYAAPQPYTETQRQQQQPYLRPYPQPHTELHQQHYQPHLQPSQANPLPYTAPQQHQQVPQQSSEAPLLVPQQISDTLTRAPEQSSTAPAHTLRPTETCTLPSPISTMPADAPELSVTKAKPAVVLPLLSPTKITLQQDTGSAGSRSQELTAVESPVSVATLALPSTALNLTSLPSPPLTDVRSETLTAMPSPPTSPTLPPSPRSQHGMEPDPEPSSLSDEFDDIEESDSPGTPQPSPAAIVTPQTEMTPMLVETTPAIPSESAPPLVVAVQVATTPSQAKKIDATTAELVAEELVTALITEEMVTAVAQLETKAQPPDAKVSKSGVTIVYDTPKEANATVEEEEFEVVEEEEIVEVLEMEETWEMVSPSKPSLPVQRTPSPEPDLGSEPDFSFDDAEESGPYFDDEEASVDKEPAEKTIMPRTQEPDGKIIMARVLPAVTPNSRYERREREASPIAASKSKRAGFGAADESIESEEQEEMVFSGDDDFGLDF